MTGGARRSGTMARMTARRWLDGDGRPDVFGHEENTNLIGRFGAVDRWRNLTPIP